MATAASNATGIAIIRPTPMREVPLDVEVWLSVSSRFIIAMAEPDQSGVSLEVNGSKAAFESSSAVFLLLSHSSDFGETTTTRLPSPDAMASITVFGAGLVDSSTSEAHRSGFETSPKVSTYSSLTSTPDSFFVFLMASVTAPTLSPSRFCVSVMLSVTVIWPGVFRLSSANATLTGIAHRSSTRQTTSATAP